MANCYPRYKSFNLPEHVPSQVELDLGDAMNEFRAIDPYGWERWYDAVIPKGASWADILKIVRSRVEQLKERKAVQEYVQGKPAGTGEMALKALETRPLEWTPANTICNCGHDIQMHHLTWNALEDRPNQEWCEGCNCQQFDAEPTAGDLTRALLGEGPEFGTAAWYKSLPMIDPETGETEQG